MAGARVDVLGQPEAGLGEGLLLIMGSWCTVLASGLLSPVLPQIAREFASEPDISLLVGFVATMPALAVALFAMPFGWLADVIGQRRVLLAGLLIYGVAGVVPFWIEDIRPIIGARALVGIGEAAVMTASTALIGLRFTEARRGRWLAAQVAAANGLGIFVLLFGGLLGLLDWHAPFLAYGFALLLLIPSFIAVRQPQRSNVNAGVSEHEGAPPPSARLLRHVAGFCGLNIASTLAMFVIIIQMAFLLPERGAANSADIGLGIACAAVGVATGATLSGLLARTAWWRRVAVGFALMGTGYVGMSLVGGFWPTAMISVIAGLGAGMNIPALISALIKGATRRVLGRVIGCWTAATFLAQFANPPVFIALRATFGSQSAAIGIFGAACLLMGASIAGVGLLRPTRQTGASTALGDPAQT